MPEHETPTAVLPVRSPPKVDRLPPYRVLLHNDDVNSAPFIVRTLQELASLDRVRAVEVMHEAHTRGLSLILVTHRERAELVQEQFTSRGVTVTIEPAE